MNYLEINSNDFWKQVFCNSENIIQPVIIENISFQQEIAVRINKAIHVEHCDTVFMEDEFVIVDIKKQMIKEVIPENNIKVLEDILDISEALLKIETYNKKNHIANLRKKFNSDKKSRV